MNKFKPQKMTINNNKHIQIHTIDNKTSNNLIYSKQNKKGHNVDLPLETEAAEVERWNKFMLHVAYDRNEAPAIEGPEIILIKAT